MITNNVYKLPVKFKLTEEDENVQMGMLLFLRLSSLEANNNPFGEVIIDRYKFENFLTCKPTIFRKNLNRLLEQGLIIRTSRPGFKSIYRVIDFNESSEDKFTA